MIFRTLKLATFGILGVWLLASAGCEDKACKMELEVCKKERADQGKECKGHQTTISEMKALLADAQAKVEVLTKENAELKAKSPKSAEPEAKGKTKAPKAKHKKKHGRR
jgi:hypothetical protein